MVIHDPISRVLTIRIRRDFGGGKRLPNGMEYDEYDPTTLTIDEGDPLSARAACRRRIEMRRGAWSTRIELESTMTANAGDYLLNTVLNAYERDVRIHSHAFVRTIPRNCS